MLTLRDVRVTEDTYRIRRYERNSRRSCEELFKNLKIIERLVDMRHKEEVGVDRMQRSSEAMMSSRRFPIPDIPTRPIAEQQPISETQT